MDLYQQYPPLEQLVPLAKRQKTGLYLVGGFLRDYYLGSLGFDFDFAVERGAINLARKFARHIKGAFVLLDSDHGSARVVVQDRHQIWTYDFTDFRGATITEDLKKRDFTINTLALDLIHYPKGESLESHIIDQHHARRYIKLKKVKAVFLGTFKDDPLRLLRAYSLQAAWDLNIEAKTSAQIKKDTDLITAVSMERVREELFKILNSPRGFVIFTELDRIGLLPKVIPQVTVMYGVLQGGYHHLNVWRHSLEVVHQFEELIKSPASFADDRTYHFIQDYLKETIGGGHTRYALLKFACLVHDIGKPDTKKKEKDRTSFHGHEHVGAGITRLVAKHLKLSVKERHFLEDIVAWHLRPGYLSNFKQPSERMVFRFLRDTKEEALSVLLLALADQRATRGKLTTQAKHEHHREICWQMIDRFIKSNDIKPQVRLITGNDLIRKLKLKPSPLFAKILNQVQEAQALGKVSTKPEALELAKKIAKI